MSALVLLGEQPVLGVPVLDELGHDRDERRW
jgi:hypothetical protein